MHRSLPIFRNRSHLPITEESSSNELEIYWTIIGGYWWKQTIIIIAVQSLDRTAFFACAPHSVYSHFFVRLFIRLVLFFQNNVSKLHLYQKKFNFNWQAYRFSDQHRPISIDLNIDVNLCQLKKSRRVGHTNGWTIFLQFQSNGDRLFSTLDPLFLIPTIKIPIHFFPLSLLLLNAFNGA